MRRGVGDDVAVVRRLDRLDAALLGDGVGGVTDTGEHGEPSVALVRHQRLLTGLLGVPVGLTDGPPPLTPAAAAAAITLPFTWTTSCLSLSRST